MSGVDISPEVVDRVLRALFTSTNGVDEFVAVQKVVYSQSARIAELETENSQLRDAVYIDDLTVTLQAQDKATFLERIAELEAKLATARADAWEMAIGAILYNKIGPKKGADMGVYNHAIDVSGGVIRLLIEKETK